MKIKILLIVSLIMAIIVGISFVSVKKNKPPEDIVMKAGRLLAQAKFEKSPKYATEKFQEATMYYKAAMTEWEKQNESFILLRDFKKVSELAQKSMECSDIAIRKSRKHINNTEDLLEMRIERIGEKIKGFDENFGNFPLDKKHRNEFAKSKILYSESIEAYKNKNYSSCKTKLDSAELVINEVFTHYQDKLTSYFEAYPKWNELVKKTLSWSKKNQSYAVIVDKFSRELFVYKNGKIYKQYAIELGVNWIGDKIQQGDKSTPEGLYKITEMKQNGKTKYYKAFLLDYPNDEDKKRFSSNKKNGIIQHDAKIGNLIEIHGSGGKGIDWTDGCVALTDSDMDELFKVCKVGTKVTIVGSTKSINELSIILK